MDCETLDDIWRAAGGHGATIQLTSRSLPM